VELVLSIGLFVVVLLFSDCSYHIIFDVLKSSEILGCCGDVTVYNIIISGCTPILVGFLGCSQLLDVAP
jgi:hypothetical protein